MDIDIPKAVYNEKIERVLKRLLDPQFKVKNDVYLNSLLTHISKYQDKNKSDDYLTNTFSCWIIQATKEWESSKQVVPTDIFAFTLNLASFISEEETRFVKLNSLNVYERLLQINDVHSSPPIIKLGFITLISSFLKHKSGLQWIIATNYWADVISITLNGHTIYVTSTGSKFIANLLDKTFNLNQTFCQNVIKSILDPLDNITESKPNTHSIHLELKNEAIAETLFPILKLVTDILNLLLELTSMGVLDLFPKRFGICTKVKHFLLLSHTEEFEYNIRRLVYLLGFIDLFKFYSGCEKVMYVDVVHSREEGIFETFKGLIAKGFPKSVLKTCFDGFIFWRTIRDKMPKCFLNDQQIKLENQLMIMQIIPIIIAGTTWLGRDNFEQLLKEDNHRDDFINKTLKLSGTKTIQTGYIWRNYLLDHKDILEITTSSLMYILKSKPFYTREGGVMAFQAFIYCLKDIITHLKAGPTTMQFRSQETKFLVTLFEAVGVFIEEFNITWKDSIESMCAMTCALEILQFNAWKPQVVIKALGLLNITINKYLAPSMILLIDTLNDASFSSLGTLLFAKCHDPFWEVRDSALEVLCTMSYNANNRFPSFQKIILDTELPHLVVNMAVKDAEPFVRASAFRCLQEMIQVKELWDNLKEIADIHELFFNVVHKENEGIVRKEATTLICKIYDNQNYHESLFPNLYDIMTHAAIADLHWEVKVNALNFWKSVINNHLQHQGMIDGTFPNVTFSKEHRKIVNLNDVEIRKRLVKVLNQLSEIGCLAVLIEAIQDDCDIQVSKSSTTIVGEFVRLLKLHEVSSQNSDLSQPPSPLITMVPSPGEFHFSDISKSAANILPNYVQKCSNISPLVQNNVLNNIDSVMNSAEMDQDVIYSVRAADVTDANLDEILNSQDINVLKTLYNPNDYSSNDSMSLHRKKILPPSEFLNFTYKNLESHLSEKSNWLNGLDDFASLLDDILKNYELTDVNTMDCY